MAYVADIPEASTQGNTVEEAPAMAADKLGLLWTSIRQGQDDPGTIEAEEGAAPGRRPFCQPVATLKTDRRWHAVVGLARQGCSPARRNFCVF